tara:strand:- start:3047 stop:3913 length:867 start_codon:yes stop_codon:yes gene_type:complete
MRLDVKIIDIIKILVPLVIILVVIFFVFRKKSEGFENYDNLKELINSTKSATELMEKTANNLNDSDSCGPKYAPSGGSQKLNNNNPSEPGPSCNNQPQYAPPYQQQGPPPPPNMYHQHPYPANYPPQQHHHSGYPPHIHNPPPPQGAQKPPSPDGIPAPVPGPPPQKREKPPTPPQERHPIPPGKSVEIKMIWAQWCGFSRKAAPEFTKLREEFANTKYNDYTLVFNDHEEGHSDFRENVTKYDIKGFPTYVVIVRDNNNELHTGKFNSIKKEDMEAKFKKEIDSVKP